MAKLPGSTFLGYTIDILGEYADVGSTIARVMTIPDDDGKTAVFEGNEFTHPSMTDYIDDTGSFEMIEGSGSSYRSYSESYSIETSGEGSYGAFSGSVNAAYSQTVTTTSSSYYYSMYQTFQGYVLSLTSPSLDPAVQSDLDKSEEDLSARAFFERWGTHVVTRVVGGGQLRYYASGSTETWDSLQTFEASARAAYGGVGGEVSGGGQQEEHVEEIQDSATLQVVGGSIEGQVSTTPTDVSSVDTTTWAETIGTNPAVIAFTDPQAPGASGLRPIWEFCTNNERRQQLEVWFHDNYAPRSYLSSWETFEDDTQEKIVRIQLEDLTDPEKLEDDDHRITKPEEWYIVGFGGTINDNGNMVRAGIMIENARTQERKGWYVGNMSGDYSYDSDGSTLEKKVIVPPGHAVTGLALHAKSQKLKHLKLWYQAINLGHSVHNKSALFRGVFTAGNTGRGDGDWDLSAITPGDQPRTTVMSGVHVSMQNNKGKLLRVRWSDFYLGVEDVKYAPVSRDPAWRVIKNDNDNRNRSLRTDDPNEFIVGFGGNVNNNGNSDKIAVCFEHARTGNRRWVTSDGSDYRKMERREVVPEGCALVGVALHGKSGKLENLKVYYQAVTRDPTARSGMALLPGRHEQGDTGHSGWEADSTPANNNTKVLSGITIGIDNNKAKYLSQRENTFALKRVN